ncbi:capsule biosynthesis protein CapK [Wenyingzhuangia fucanilytica]|uniref:Capsule biosynthesis protein CapK n=1 Tax=Wenyingzhuangia fucanilytica TaxID=1790137 RepID=A0A1B1Y687_9FLAO|nr:phenylacetate--CoA ligase family protein [Wenyingzhuangia fucanilytica]ANW96292.1 capsule biosynthesis protein CapK [Wenyingzhuangia fucanilytica]
MFYKLIFKLGQQLRNPSINSWFSFLKQSESWSLEDLEAYQLKRLKELLQFANDHSPFYKKHFKDHQFSVADVKSLKDIDKVPVITKRTLLDHTQEIHTQYDFKKLIKATTSGSSGESLVFNRNEEADSFNRAAIFRGYSWYNVNPWDKNGYFWGFNFSFKEKVKTKILDFLQHRFRIFSYEKKSFEQFVSKLKNAKYIHGYSSMLFQTAKLINERSLAKPKGLKMIKGTSEKIFDTYQEEVQKAFGLKIISEYGATESGIIAFECPKGKMHINMEGVLVEEVNDEILVTNLQMKSFPVIRYQLGDYIQLAPKEELCTCGKKHRILKEVTGRVGSNVYGYKEIYPSLYFYYIFKNLVKNNGLKLNYQVIQNKKGLLEFCIEQSMDDHKINLLKEEIKKYFSNDVAVEIMVNVSLQSTQGKFKSFISNINE